MAGLAVLAACSEAAAKKALPPTATELAAQASPVDGFDFPVGDGRAEGYYNAQGFGESSHLGDDWNGVGGGNTDLGDPVLAAGDGVVVSATDVGRGWGNVVRIVHNAGSDSKPMWVESLYAHLDRIDVEPGASVARGAKVGTIGTASGRYPAHLHFELRGVLDMPIGRGYSDETRGYLDPTAFIKKHRPEK